VATMLGAFPEVPTAGHRKGREQLFLAQSAAMGAFGLVGLVKIPDAFKPDLARLAAVFVQGHENDSNRQPLQLARGSTSMLNFRGSVVGRLMRPRSSDG
jgi:hypothetical protein